MNTCSLTPDLGEFHETDSCVTVRLQEEETGTLLANCLSAEPQGLQPDLDERNFRKKG